MMDDSDEIPEDLADLLKQLDPDQERANEQFTLLRRRLVAVCRNRRIQSSKIEDVVHETLLRLYRQLNRIGNKNLFYYALSILRNVILEGGRAPEVKREEEYDPTNPGHQIVTESHLDKKDREEYEQSLINCMRECLNRLKPEEANLYRDYKGLSSHDRVGRDSIAAAFGKSRNALNAEISRIGERLRKCIKKCMKKLGLKVQ